jgi:hypothetical protein
LVGHLPDGRFTYCQNAPEQSSDRDDIAGLGTVRPDTQHAAFGRFDFLGCFFTFHTEERVANPHGVSVCLEPTFENALFHRPSESWDSDFDRHADSPVKLGSGSFCCEVRGRLASGSTRVHGEIAAIHRDQGTRDPRRVL